MEKSICPCFVELVYSNASKKCVCFGTKEMEECTCKGLEENCNFYPQKRTKKGFNVTTKTKNSKYLSEIINKILFLTNFCNQNNIICEFNFNHEECLQLELIKGIYYQKYNYYYEVLDKNNINIINQISSDIKNFNSMYED